MKTYKAQAIILKRRNLGEADRILTVLTRGEGKIQVKAPGVRKITSRRSSHVELLNLSTLTLYGNTRFLPIVTEAQTLEDFSGIKNNLKKIGYAYYICELMNGLCAEGEENRGVFYLLSATLFALSKTDQSELVVRFFQKELLANLGFWTEARRLQTQDSREVMEGILEKKLTTTRILQIFQA